MALTLQQQIDNLQAMVDNLSRESRGLIHEAGGGGGGDSLIHAANFSALAAITDSDPGQRGMTDDNGYIYVFRKTPKHTSLAWRIEPHYEQDSAPSSIGELEGDLWRQTGTNKDRWWQYTSGNAWEYMPRQFTSKSASGRKLGDIAVASAKAYCCTDEAADSEGFTYYNT